MKNRSSRAAKAREFSTKAREEIFLRDRGQCIFCMKLYRMDERDWIQREILQVMHYVPRSKNGLGIPKNGALGCMYHHNMLDNGHQGHRKEMLEIFREYLKSKYKDWSEEDLVWNKWRETNGR